MTIQERLRRADDPVGVNAGFNDMVAGHIDQLEADKAELVKQLQWHADDCVACAGTGEWAGGEPCVACADDRDLITKHRPAS